MHTHNEAQSVQLHRDTDMRAQVLLDVGMSMPHQFSRNGRTFSAETAFQSQVLVRDLLKLGLFSMNIQLMAGLRDDTGNIPVSFARVPESLLGVGLHYAISVAPTDPQEEEPVVLIDNLEKHVQILERHFGQIDVDMGLVARVAQWARDTTLSPDFSNGEG